MRVRTAIAALAVSIIPIMADAQPHRQQISTNKGLVCRMDEADLPRSGAAVVMPEAVPFEARPTVLRELADGVWSVENGWSLISGEDRETGADKRYNAVVPGTVLTTLVASGVYPDPYFGVNNMAIPEDLCRKDWWYQAELPLTSAQLSSNKLELLLNGVNYACDVWFNGVKLGSVRGAFIRGWFDITALAKASNAVSIHIYPPYNPGIPHEQSMRSGRGPNGGQLCLDGPTFISSEGWDWVPGIRDRNIGLWQDVQLIASRGISLGDTQVITDLPLPDTDYADVIVRTSIDSDMDSDVSVTATIQGTQAGSSMKLSLERGENLCDLSFRLDEPKLWMPNGYGEQNLYTLELKVEKDGQLLAAQSTRFGVREFSYELSVDTPTRKALRIDFDPTDLAGRGPIFNNRLQRRVVGETEIPSLAEGVDESVLRVIQEDEMAPYLVVRCNGVRIFCRGGNWGMDDAMKNCSREKLEPYFMLHRDAGFNMVRNWTGESTEEMFYTLCDEYGMLVWNDFWISTEGYNLDPNDEDLFMENVEDVLKRFRNHPSIAIWCPRNEGYATETLEKRLAEAVARLDGTRRYHPNSRFSNLRTSGPWHYLADPAEYYTARAFGFNTEMGTPSIPTAETMRKFLAEADYWPLNDVWCYHDLHFETEPYLAAMSRKYGEPVSMDDFCRKAQLINYESYRAMFESYNSHMWNNTSGLLLWMTHPAWPSVEWQAYSWDCETFGSYFGCRKACEPLHIQYNLDNGDVVVVNTTTSDAVSLTATATLFSLAGKKLWTKSVPVGTAPANSLTNCFEAGKFEKEGVLRVELKDARGAVLSVNDYLTTADGSYRGLDAEKASVSAKWGKNRTFVVRNTSRTASAIALKFNVRNAETGEAVLPAFFSDAYINLLPGESRTISFDCAGFEKGTHLISVVGYNVDGKTLLK